MTKFHRSYEMTNIDKYLLNPKNKHCIKQLCLEIQISLNNV